MIPSKSSRKCVGVLTKGIQKAWLRALCFGWCCSSHTAWPLCAASEILCIFVPPSMQPPQNLKKKIAYSWRYFKSKEPAESRQLGWSQAHRIFEELSQLDLVKLIYLDKNSLWRTSHNDLGWSERTGHLLVGMMLDTGLEAEGELERHQVVPLGGA